MGDEVNQVNALYLAKERGIKVIEHKLADVTGYASLIKVTAATDKETHTLAGTVIEKEECGIIEIEGYHLDIAPSGNLVVIDHTDQPGVIGEIGTIIGQQGINIAAMQVGRKQQGGVALMVLNVDSTPDAVITKLEKVKTVARAWAINL